MLSWFSFSTTTCSLQNISLIQRHKQIKKNGTKNLSHTNSNHKKAIIATEDKTKCKTTNITNTNYILYYSYLTKTKGPVHQYDKCLCV